MVTAQDGLPRRSVQAVYGTEADYDADGRAVGTERISGLVIALVNDNGSMESVVKNAGTVVWSTSSDYGATGELLQTVGRQGEITNYEYDSAGRQTAEVGPVILDPITGQLVRDRTEWHYNTAGQLAYTIEDIRVVVNAQGNVLSTDYADARKTQYEYDALGNVVLTTYADGSFVTDAYDNLGRKVAGELADGGRRHAARHPVPSTTTPGS